MIERASQPTEVARKRFIVGSPWDRSLTSLGNPPSAADLACCLHVRKKVAGLRHAIAEKDGL